MDQDEQQNAVGQGFAWAARVLAGIAVLFLPGWGGRWLDRRFGWQWGGPIGICCGLGLGTLYLIGLVRAESLANRRRKSVRVQRDLNLAERGGTDRASVKSDQLDGK